MGYPVIKTEGGMAPQSIAPNLRQLTRGNGAVFEVDFFDDAPSNTQPSVPANPAQYPAWSIVDPSGVQLASGVGSVGSSPGRWTASWSCPPSAPLSTQHQKWKIVWNMVTTTNRQLQRTDPFDVIELRTPDTLQDLRQHAYLVYLNKSERLILRLPRRPDMLTVEGFASTSLTNPTPGTTAAWSGSLAGASITEVQEQNLFAYIYDTPALSTPGEFQIVWNYRQTVTSPNDTTTQKLFIPPPVFWSLAPSLRVLIDKLQKKYGSIQAYTDSDIYEYFQRGIGILNGITPNTNWDLCTFPYTASTVRFLIEGAALWAMQAQYLLQGELRFSFSGQTVTLDVDNTDIYDTTYSRLLEDLTGSGKGSWPATKVDVIRQMTPITYVGNRLMRTYQPNAITYKVFSDYIGSATPPTLAQFPGPFSGGGWTLTSVLTYLNLI
jgi:hypothetical protein